MLPAVEAVLFDLDHTLAIDNRLEERVLCELSARYCRAPLTDAQIMGALLAFRSGTVGLADALREAFAACSCGSEIVETYKATALRLLPSGLQPLPDARAMLDGLRERGLRLAILTNGWRELQRAKAAGIGFDGPVIVSDEIGAWKPDARAFTIAGDALGIDLARAAYVGDSPVTDVAGSAAAGMVSVWANLEGRTYPGGVTPPMRTIERLVELLDLFDPPRRTM